MPITKTEKIWMDGELVDWDDARIHILTHTLHYGCGVFEGIRAYPTDAGPAVFRLTDHINRLFNSAKIFIIDVPFTPEEIVEATKTTVRVNGLPECYIRPIVYLGYGEMGLNPLPCPVNVSIAVWPWGAYLGGEGIANGVRMKISSWQRHDPNAMPPAAKGTGMYINSSMAKIEALKAGYDEAILLSPQGYVSECTGENIFVVRGGRIITPPTSAGALEGITQSSVMTIARDLGFEVEVGNLLRSDLYTADEAFLSGTAAEVVPIASVDDRVVGDGRPGPITRRIQEVFHARRPRPGRPLQGLGRACRVSHRARTGHGHHPRELPDAVDIYDTTLRDGSQQEGLSLTVDDKLRVAEQLDHLGVQYIEGGWPGANPKDEEFFRRAAAGELHLQTATLVAFGSTRKAGGRAETRSGAGRPARRPDRRGLPGRQVGRVARHRDAAHHAHRSGSTWSPTRSAIWSRRAGGCSSTPSTSSTATGPILASAPTSCGPPPTRVPRCSCCATPMAAACRSRSSGSSARSATRLDIRLGCHFHNDSGCAVANSLSPSAWA